MLILVFLGLPVLQETNKMFALINPEKDFDNEGLKDIPRQMVGNQISKMLQHELFKGDYLVHPGHFSK